MTAPDGFDAKRWSASLDSQTQREAIEQAHISDEEAAAWAMMLAGSLPKPQHTPEGLSLLQKGAESSSLSQGTGTQAGSCGAPSESRPGATTGSQPADTNSVNDAHRERLVLNVDSETLGRVQLIVDREEGGVRVLVGSSHDAKSRLSAGKHTLGEAMSAAGVRVNSLRFVTQGEVGTVLAQERLSKRARDESTKDDTRDDAPSHSRNKKKRNLNLIG